MNKYRTHLCSELNISNLNEVVIISGWIDTVRDHGNLIFIDLQLSFIRISNSLILLSANGTLSSAPGASSFL